MPVSLLTTHVPAVLGRTYSRDELASGSLIRLLERGGARRSGGEHNHGEARGSFSAPLLNVQVGQPLIGLTRTVRDEKRRPIEYLSALYRPDQYEVRLSMSRDGSGSPNLWRYQQKAEI